jgi:hypothetical protein
MRRVGMIYIGLVLFPVLIGLIMGLVMNVLARRKDRKYENLLKSARKNQQAFSRDFSVSLESIEESIQKLRLCSEILKTQTGKLRELDRWFREKNGSPAVKVEKPETRSLTLENNVITDLRMIHPADEPILQELSPLLQSHQRSRFFPRK